MKLTLKDSNKKQLADGIKISKLLNINGYKAFWVGGTVRDLILKRLIDNVDIATNAKPDEVEAVLHAHKIKTKPFGKKFGTILAVIKDMPIEITTFRAEGRYSDQRHPDSVIFVDDYRQDSKRRDFTINSLYYDLKNGEVLDPENGLRDIQGKLIKFVGKATHRIDEDPLRMMRAVRFAAQLDFKIEKNSYSAIKVRAKLIQKISGERIKSELDKIILSPNRVKGLQLLNSIGLLKFIVPELSKLLEKTLSQKNILQDSFSQAFSMTGHKSELDLIYANMFLTIKSESRIEAYANFAQRLRFAKKNRRLIEWLLANYDKHTGFTGLKPSSQLKLVEQPSFPKLLKMWEGSSAYKHAKKSLLKYNLVEPLIRKLADGESIIKLSKLKPGPHVKEKISEITEKIFTGEIKTLGDVKKLLTNSEKST